MSAETVITRIKSSTDKEVVENVRQRPILTNSVVNFDPAQVLDDAERTRIVVHDRFQQLVENFLAHKRQRGTEIEKALYNASGWNWQKQVARLGTYTFGYLLCQVPYAFRKMMAGLAIPANFEESWESEVTYG